MTILVITVSYQSDGTALRFVDSLTKAVNGMNDVSVTLVDNTERETSSEFFERVAQVNPGVICLKPAGNLGYFGGANFGLQEYLQRNGGEYPDWLLVSNADILFSDESFFVRLKEMRELGEIGVIAPSIWSDVWHIDRNPKLVSRPSRRRMYSYRFLYHNFYLVNLYVMLGGAKSRLKSVFKTNTEEPAEGQLPVGEYAGSSLNIQQIYAAQGSCFVFSRQYFQRGGSLDYPVFLFGEEIFIAETARELGLQIIYNPSLRLTHEDHDTTGILRSRRIASYMYDSVVYLAERYFRRD